MAPPSGSAAKAAPRPIATRIEIAGPHPPASPPHSQGALLSIIFNRGAKLTGSRREEMAAIKPLAAKGDLDCIADQIVRMKRLRVGKGVDGLLKRRNAEAEMVRKAAHNHHPATVVHV